MIVGKINDDGIVIDTFVVNSLSEMPNTIELNEWVGIGMPFDAPNPNIIVIPSTVSMRQARLALLESNLLETVNAAINQGGEADKITWEYATEVNRSDALVLNMAIALNLSETDLDNLFTLASSL